MFFFKRVYTVMEIRTGFATGLPVLSSGILAATMAGRLNIPLLILMFISGFSFNIACNIAAEIKGFLIFEDDNYLTGHNGSEGLARGDVSIYDAMIGLILSFGLGTISGLLIVVFTKSLFVLGIGILSAVAAISYSLGPKPYSKYPVGELVSGTFVGAVSSLVSGYIQLGRINIGIILFSCIAFVMTVFLMSTNNTSDYEKDFKTRKTLPHVIGFKNSIKIIKYEAIFMILCFVMLFVLGYIGIITFLIGIIIFYHSFYAKWYKDYKNIEKPYKEMGREYGPRPLILIYNFNIVMAVLFFIKLI